MKLLVTLRALLIALVLVACMPEQAKKPGGCAGVDGYIGTVVKWSANTALVSVEGQEGRLYQVYGATGFDLSAGNVVVFRFVVTGGNDNAGYYQAVCAAKAE